MIKENKRTGNGRHARGRWLGNPRGVSGLRMAGALFFLMLFSFSLFSQKPGTPAKFKVKYMVGDYKFFPADAYLFVGTQNRLKITNNRNAKFEVKVTNGSVSKTNDSTIVIDGLTDFGATLISVYERDAKGKKKLVVNKPYTVISYPKVKLAGVACDSAMPAIQMAAGGMSVYYKSLGSKVPVTGFKMEYYEKDKFVLDSSNNNRLSKKMLAYVEKLKPGSLVYMTDIKYKDPNGAEHREPIYRVFIISDKNVLKFGVD